MSVVPMNRKRHRSVECQFVGQSKQYVNENLVNAQDEAKMKAIYSKTVSLLFKGASHHFNQIELDHDKEAADAIAEAQTESAEPVAAAATLSHRDRLKQVRLLGGGEYQPINGGTMKAIPAKTDRRCFSCVRESRFHGDCSSCSQEMCEHCGFSCLDCNEPLCSNCVNLFDCGTADSPCCSRCQLYK